ncbi:uncharacterized protein JN550_005995 [Neoarthrinium moseri]|uniref:uncharacterized protein n=1 Tax=Neoarthrinium moseri TaxID=1658444 RepID=UPI001FDC3E4F|nr:uncharacterized protein JN550_005995 [Neoarthrinium moseri]KAI1869008.1 hypothetical protein JN550_005995 [Neoarthrinium moseri]
MLLFLIRHGESVDNVAGVYAGVRDSPLTNHGVLQAKRLGAHLASRRDVTGPVVSLFTSNLRRAYLTAEAIADAQGANTPRPDGSSSRLEPVQLTELREKNFGSGEGIKYGALSSRRTAGDLEQDEETREQMTVRVNRFIDTHLRAILEKHAPEKVSVVIVAHGLILGSLLKALTTHFPDVNSAPSQGPHEQPLASWSNTGVLQAKIKPTCAADASTSALDGQRRREPLNRLRLSMMVQLVNNVDHLVGLKKTRGGIGSARFDTRQRKMTSFFTPAKKRKADEAE